MFVGIIKKKKHSKNYTHKVNGINILGGTFELTREERKRARIGQAL